MQFRLPGETMRHTITIEDEVWERRSGGGWLPVAMGVSPLGLGLWLLLWGGGLFKLKGGAGPPPPWVTLGFGVPLVLFGLVLMIGRSGTAIDRRTGTVVRWWGFLGPFIRRLHPVHDFDRVTLSEAWRHTRYERNLLVYPIHLVGAGGRLLLAQPRNGALAGRLAYDLAKFLDLPLEQGTNGEKAAAEGQAPEGPG